MNVGELCVRDVVFTTKESSIQQVAKLMRAYHVGDIIVVEEKDIGRVPVGIITDRDIVIEFLAPDIDVNSVTVGDAMSFDLLTAREEEDVFDLLKKMAVKGVRRVPVINSNGTLEGVVSVDDLIDVFSEQMMNFVKIFFKGRERERETREL